MGSLAPGAEGVVDRCCRAGNSDDSTRAHNRVYNIKPSSPHTTRSRQMKGKGQWLKRLLTPKSLEVTACEVVGTLCYVAKGKAR